MTTSPVNDSVTGKNPAHGKLQGQPPRKKQKFEKIKGEETIQLSLLETLPIEVQHYIFSFLFGQNRYPLISDLTNRNVVILSRVSRGLRHSVFNFFRQETNKIIGPLRKSLEQIQPGSKKVAYARGASMITLNGMRAFPKQCLPCSDLLFLDIPTPEVIESLLWAINGQWSLAQSADDSQSCKPKVSDCLAYFTKEEIEKNPAVAAFLLHYLGVSVDDQLLMKFLQRVNRDGNLQALIEISHGRVHSHVVDIVLAEIIDLENPSEALESLKEKHPSLLLERTDGGENIAQMAARFGRASVLDWLKAQDDMRHVGLLTSLDSAGRNIAHFAVCGGNDAALNWLSEQKEEELQNLLTSKEPIKGRSISHLAGKEPKNVYNILYWLWDNEKLHGLLYDKDKTGKNILHLLFKNDLEEEIADGLWETETLRDLFMEKTDNGRTLGHIAARYQLTDNFFWIAGKNELFPLLLEIDHRGNNVAHCAAQSGDTEILDWIEGNKRLAPLLLAHNVKRRNIAHHVARTNLLEPLVWIAERSYLHQLLHVTDINGQNIAHFAARSDSVSILEFIAGQNALGYLLDAKDEKGQDLKAIATAFASTEVLKWLEAREKAAAETDGSDREKLG